MINYYYFIILHNFHYLVLNLSNPSLLLNFVSKYLRSDYYFSSYYSLIFFLFLLF